MKTLRDALLTSAFCLLTFFNLQAAFHPIGFGGGGSLYAPASSPHDPHLMFASCDMGGFYRSTDEGATWSLLDQRNITGSTHCRPAFDPFDPKVIFMGAGSRLFKSSDAGVTWQSVSASFPWTSSGEEIYEVAINHDSPTTMLLGTNQFVYRSTDRGGTWAKATGPAGAAAGFFIDRVNSGHVFAGTSTGVWLSNDGGATWNSATTGLPAGATINSLTGTSNPIFGGALCYVAVSGAANGLFRRANVEATWSRQYGTGLNSGDEYTYVAMMEGDTNVVYATNNGTSYSTHATTFNVFRTTNGGANWINVYNCNPHFVGTNVDLGWNALEFGVGWGGPAFGFSVNADDPNVVMFTNSGEMQITTNGGDTWHQSYSTYIAGQGTPVAGKLWTTNGLNVTSVWHHYFDPFDSNRTYLCYTDIGFARSTDRGSTWMISSKGSPWINTFYDLAFTPNAGTMFAACSNKHDIPYWNAIDSATEGNYPGGVCMSTDYGATWTSTSNGLPARAVTSIMCLPLSGVAPYYLYCTVWGSGVYRSTDQGQNWTAMNTGLRTNNMHTYSIKRDSSFNLYVLVAGKRVGSNFPEHGGLYKSTDAGLHWVSLMDSLHYLVDFAVHPTNPQIIYLTCFDATGGKVQGGVYKTTNGGGHWERSKQFYDPFCPTFAPNDPNTVYVADDNGLWRTTDAGTSWFEINGPPFRTLTRESFDPLHADSVIVCTFGGGAWKGESGFTTVGVVESTVPESTELITCYPSPFHDDLTIGLSADMQSAIRSLKIVDMLGRTVADLTQSANASNLVHFNAATIPEGMYWIELDTGSSRVRRMVARVRN